MLGRVVDRLHGRSCRPTNLTFDRRYTYVMRSLRYSINVTLDYTEPAGEIGTRLIAAQTRTGR